MLRYFLERFMYDAGRAVVREGVKQRRIQQLVSDSPQDAQLEIQTIYANNLRQLAHQKYDLIKVDDYGLIDDDAWIDYYTLWVRHELVAKLSHFSQATAMNALNASSAQFIADLNGLVRQIAATAVAQGTKADLKKDRAIIAGF